MFELNGEQKNIPKVSRGSANWGALKVEMPALQHKNNGRLNILGKSFYFTML